MINRLQAVWEPSPAFFVNVTTGGYGLELRESDNPTWHFYILGLLNSRLLDFYLRCKSSHFHSGYFPANKQFIQRLPIRLPATAKEQKVADQIAQRVERIIAAKKQLQVGVAGDRAAEPLEREIESRQQKIDELACRLYGVDELPDEG